MLGLGRASQYAGWWSGQPPTVTFTTASALVYENKQTPSYSLLIGSTNASSPAKAWNINSLGNYDLTNYDLNTAFNNERYTIVLTVKLTWPTTGVPSGDNVTYTITNEVKDNGNINYLTSNILLQTGDVLDFGTLFGGGSLVLPGTYDQYMDQWLTIVYCGSETSASFTNWNQTAGTTGTYQRLAVFDTVTGVLLGKRDFRSTYSYPSIENWPDTTPANTTGTYGYFANGSGSGPGAVSGDWYDGRTSNYWVSFGTMFDPLTTTNTSWRTTRPTAVIDTGVAWLNLQMTAYEDAGTEHYVTVSGQDLYSESNDRVARTNGWLDADWTNMYSDTDITTDQG